MSGHTPAEIYPDDLAAKMKDRVGQRYRPSNGTEGDFFMEALCNRCVHDAEWRCDQKNPCDILSRSFAFDIDDDKYPTEWQYGADGQPTCTAFQVEVGK